MCTVGAKKYFLVPRLLLTLVVGRSRHSNKIVSLETLTLTTYQLPCISMQVPSYRGFQMIGDSQLVRFSEQILNARRVVNSSPGQAKRVHIGYCVSGQKIGELLAMLKRNEFVLGDKIIMLIGTNDMTYVQVCHSACLAKFKWLLFQETPFNMMVQQYNMILDLMKQKQRRVILLTVPPVPKMEVPRTGSEYLEKLQNFNKFILQKHNCKFLF